MRTKISPHDQAELTELRKLSARIGSDLRYTQASSGNSSIKLGDTLWIKASGTWMANALDHEAMIPLNLPAVRSFVQQQIDPAGNCVGASIETAMHAVLPHRVVLHIHCVNTIAWAVRTDAPLQLCYQLSGLHWSLIPYVPSGLPLAQEITKAVSTSPETNIFVLSNHGLVVCADDCQGIADLLAQVEQRLEIHPRPPARADYATLKRIAADSPWLLPDDNEVHVLGTDSTARSLLSGGLLYPGQSFCSNSNAAELFHPVPCPDSVDSWIDQYSPRPFLIIEGRGVLVSKTMTPTQQAMMSGLAQVIRRISPTAPLRYLSEEEVASSYGIANAQYHEIANACRNGT